MRGNKYIPQAGTVYALACECSTSLIVTGENLQLANYTALYRLA